MQRKNSEKPKKTTGQTKKRAEKNPPPASECYFKVDYFTATLTVRPLTETR